MEYVRGSDSDSDCFTVCSENWPFFSRFFREVVIPNCRSRGIEKPHAPSFFELLVEDSMRARFMQNTSSLKYEDKDRLEELGDFYFYRNQCWRHMHNVLRSQGITFQELGHQCCNGVLASLEVQGFTGEGVASLEQGHQRCSGALDSLEGGDSIFGARTSKTQWGRRLP